MRDLVKKSYEMIHLVAPKLAETDEGGLVYLNACVALYNIEHSGAEMTLAEYVKKDNEAGEESLEIKDW